MDGPRCTGFIWRSRGRGGFVGLARVEGRLGWVGAGLFVFAFDEAEGGAFGRRGG